MSILFPLRDDLITEIRCPYDLVCRVLDLFTLEKVGTVLVTGKVDDLVLLFPLGLFDGEQDSIA